MGTDTCRSPKFPATLRAVVFPSQPARQAVLLTTHVHLCRPATRSCYGRRSHHTTTTGRSDPERDRDHPVYDTSVSNHYTGTAFLGVVQVQLKLTLAPCRFDRREFDCQRSLYHYPCKLNILVCYIFKQNKLDRIDFCPGTIHCLLCGRLTHELMAKGDADSFSWNKILLWDRHHFCKFFAWPPLLM